ncbi:zonadhesin-like isoform X2 [Oppia nitens]|uniref:zonadhesin-like isoform X2 n=1 Tax=Oppia nitens TaxID=1686743 RepID=UPI0023DCD510|nr:zonadhesin-like isoform X2 [Oppia nitens]
MYFIVVLVLMMNVLNSFQSVIRDCRYIHSNGTHGLHCPLFSQLTCPTKCDPSCQRPLIKRTMCSQPITCPERACVCSPDYVKDNDHKCIPLERCSENCPSNEIYKLCPPSCEIHCGNVDKPPKGCPEDEREDHECIADCVCPSGLIRDYSTEKCVKKEMCSKANCRVLQMKSTTIVVPFVIKFVIKIILIAIPKTTAKRVAFVRKALFGKILTQNVFLKITVLLS